MQTRITRTAEHVSEGHPDKFCDQVADRILDEALSLTKGKEEERNSVRTAIECLAKDNLLVVSGEVSLPERIRGSLDVTELARQVWEQVGYGTNVEELTVINHVRSQSADIKQGVDPGGAGDQGIMVGYATDETAEFMPREWLYARNICLRLAELRKEQKLPWLRSDCKSQVTVNGEGKVTNVIIAAQHEAIGNGITDKAVLKQIEEDFLRKIRIDIQTHVISAVLPNEPERMVVNGTGKFVIGGPTGDAGVVGRKIVVDAYGPRVPVGGGAYSGKDPTKVDRSAAYMARLIAKTVVAEKVAGAKECTVKIAYGIGQPQPEMVTAVTEQGRDVSDWVKERFKDLSPQHIIESLGLRKPEGWSYLDTAAYGHYGRAKFPWERAG